MTKLIAFGILFTLIGAILVIIGLILWKKQKISLIHDYHYTKVKTEDIKPYTEAMGKATIAKYNGLINHLFSLKSRIFDNLSMSPLNGKLNNLFSSSKIK